MSKELNFLSYSSIKHFILLVLMTIVSTFSIAQYTILYNDAGGDPLLTEDINTCQSFEEVNSARLIIVSDGADNTTITLTMPTGVSYVDGSVDAVSSVGGLDIVQTTFDPVNPVFSITPSDLNSGDEIIFSWEREADCNAVDYQMSGGTFKDILEVSGDGGSFLENNMNLNTYDVLVAALSILGHAPVTTTIGSTESVQLEITNGGQGCVEELTFYIINDNGIETTGLSGNVSGTTLTADVVNGDTSFYTISSAFLVAEGLGNCFDNGEQLFLDREAFISSCETDTRYGVRWGCNGRTDCQIPFEAPGQFNIALGVPNISAVMSNKVQGADYCTSGFFEFTITNTGSETQSGAGTAFDIVQMGGSNASGLSLAHTAASTDLLGATVNGVAVPFTTVGTPGFTVDFGLLMSDPDGPGGLEDLDGDLQFDDLAVGDSYVLVLEMLIVCDETSCPTSHSAGSLKTGVDFKNQCDEQMERHLRSTGPSFSDSQAGGASVFGPTDLFDGQQFEVEYCFSRRIGSDNSLDSHVETCPTNEVGVEIDIPTGYTLVNGSTALNGTLIPGTQTGNLVEMFGDVGLGGSGVDKNFCFTMEFILDCPAFKASGDESIFDFEGIYDCDINCSCKEKWACQIYNPNPHCGLCTEGGLTGRRTEAIRTTVGWEDAYLQNLVDPSTLAGTRNLKQAMPCDTICFDLLSRQFDGTSGPTWDNAHLRISYTEFGSNKNFIPAGGDVIIYDASANTHTTCPIPTPVETEVGGKHFIEYDFTSLIGTCLDPSFIWEPNDSVNVLAYNYVNKDDALPGDPTQVEDMSIVFFNYDANGEMVTCDSFSMEVYLHEPVFSAQGGGLQVYNGCDPRAVSMTVIYNGAANVDLYPGEIRPYARADEFIWEANNGLAWNPSVPVTLTARGDASKGYPISITLPAPTIVGDQHIWTNDGTWPYGDRADNISLSGYSIAFGTLATCESEDAPSGASNRPVLRREYSNYAYSHDPDCLETARHDNTYEVDVNLPRHELINTTGTIQATTKDFCWNVDIENQENFASGFVWAAFEENASTLNITSLNGASGSLTPYTNGVWAEVSEDLDAGGSISLEVCSELTICQGDSVLMIMGWNCPGYPTEPTAYPCELDSVWLKVEPLPSEVQLVVNSEPNIPLPLCTEQQVEVQVSSAQAAFLDNPQLDILLPSGTFITSTITTEYPAGSGNIENASFTQSGTLYSLDLEAHSGISSIGIPGTIDALTPEDREVIIRFSVNTDCDFTSGSGIVFQAFGDRPCGDPAINNGVRARTSDLSVLGADLPFASSIDADLATDPKLIGCNGTEVEVSLEFVGLSSNQTTDEDSVFVTLDPGVEYVGGSFVCCSTDPGTCLNVSDVQVLGSGQTKIALAMPAGGLDITNPVNSCFTIEIKNSSNAECDVLRALTVEAVGSITGVQCGTAPGGECPSLKIITGQESIEFDSEKTELNLIDSEISCTSVSNQVDFNLDLQLDSMGLLAGNEIVVDVFCADGNGMTAAYLNSETISGPVAAGTQVQVMGMIDGNLCNLDNGIIVQISAVSNSGNDNCVCEEIVIPSGPIVCPECPDPCLGVNVTIITN